MEKLVFVLELDIDPGEAEPTMNSLMTESKKMLERIRPNWGNPQAYVAIREDAQAVLAIFAPRME